MKKFLSLLLVLGMLPALSACSKAEIDKTAIIEAVFVSKTAQGKTYRFKPIENESPVIQKEYVIAADTLSDAKAALEKESVSDLFFGQLEILLFTDTVTLEELKADMRYFQPAYECAPFVRPFFTDAETLKYIQEEQTDAEQIAQMSLLLKKENPSVSGTLLELCNALYTQQEENIQIPFLTYDDSLKVHSVSIVHAAGKNE